MALIKRKYNPVYLEQSKAHRAQLPSTVLLILSVIAGSALLIYPLLRPYYDYRPDFMLVVALYWSVQFPHRYYFGFMFAIGLLSDVLQNHWLGIHAFTYTLTLYLLVNLFETSAHTNAAKKFRAMAVGVLIATLLLCLAYVLFDIAKPWQPLLTIVPALLSLMLINLLLMKKSR